MGPKHGIFAPALHGDLRYVWDVGMYGLVLGCRSGGSSFERLGLFPFGFDFEGLHSRTCRSIKSESEAFSQHGRLRLLSSHRIDLILLPILGLAFFALQLDRGNIASALTSTLGNDLASLRIKSTLIGPRVWLSSQIIAWGLVATFQAFITSYASYLVTRLLLGLLEAGFVPGSLYYLFSWYKKEETSLHITLFFFGQMFSAATSTLIGAGILSLDGKHGPAGWQWLWLIDGLITISSDRNKRLKVREDVCKRYFTTLY